jgi:tRNA threonylcarbamoyladenosine biosynthesis protein TsaE
LATAGADETRAAGARLALVLRGGDVVLLVGPLGAGKTTLVQGVVEALGAEEPATSPTFTLAHTYRTAPPITHVDLWRLERLQEVVDLALEEALDDGGVVLAEWGDAAEPLYGEDALVVRLGWGDSDDARTIAFEPRGPSWEERAPALESVLGTRTPAGGSP